MRGSDFHMFFEYMLRFVRILQHFDLYSTSGVDYWKEPVFHSTVCSHLFLDVLELLLELLYISIDIGVILVPLEGRDVPAGCLDTTEQHKDRWMKEARHIWQASD